MPIFGSSGSGGGGGDAGRRRLGRRPLMEGVRFRTAGADGDGGGGNGGDGGGGNGGGSGGGGSNNERHYRTFPDYSSPRPPSSPSSEGLQGCNNGDAFRWGSKSFSLSAEAMDTWEKNRNIYANRYRDTSKRFRGVWNLMMLWKGSVMKLVWHDLLVFLVLYTLLNVLYRTVLFHDPHQREIFELLCIYASRFRHLIPITFLTGFYVSEVVSRYWDQFMTLPFPDKIALKLVSFIPGQDPFRRNLRRTVMRYVNLSIILVYRLVSLKVHKRLPTLQSLVESRLLLRHEAERLRQIDERTPHESTWTPLLWALKLIQRARTEGKIVIEAPVYGTLVAGFDYIETSNRKILNYGWVNFPLAYTQVATISVFLYFATSLFGAQYLVPQDTYVDNSTFPHLSGISFSISDQYKPHTPYLYIPFFTILEFVSYMGWIKVAETLLNPFGDDDEDFQINYLIDRNLQVSYMIVDDAEMQLEMAPDPFLEAGIAVPSELPYQESNQRDESSRKVTGLASDEPDASNAIGGSIRKGIRRVSRRLTIPQNIMSAAGGGGGNPTAGQSGAAIGGRRNSSMASIPEQTESDDGEGQENVIAMEEAAGSCVAADERNDSSEEESGEGDADEVAEREATTHGCFHNEAFVIDEQREEKSH